MKFVAIFTVLIVAIISQQSTLSLPLSGNDLDISTTTDHQTSTTVVSKTQKRANEVTEDSCEKGKILNRKGVCEEIPSSAVEITETSTALLIGKAACPENYVKSDDGCLFVRPKSGSSTTTVATVPLAESSPQSDVVDPRNEKSCEEGTILNAKGVCERFETIPRTLEPCKTGSVRSSSGRCVEEIPIKKEKISETTPIPTTTTMAVDRRDKTLDFTTESPSNAKAEQKREIEASTMTAHINMP